MFSKCLNGKKEKKRKKKPYSKALAQSKDKLMGTLSPPPPSLTTPFLYPHYLTFSTCFEGLLCIEHCVMGLPDVIEFNPQESLVQMEMNICPLT